MLHVNNLPLEVPQDRQGLCREQVCRVPEQGHREPEQGREEPEHRVLQPAHWRQAGRLQTG